MTFNIFNKQKQNRRVLVVEDDAMLARVITESLKEKKIKVLGVVDGLAVMDETIKFAPQVILLDLILPGIDGFEVLKQLKAEPKTANIPVIVLSNLDQPSDVKAVKALGADQFFLKATTKIDTITSYVEDKINE